MNESSRNLLDALTTQFFLENYNYTYLDAMLRKGKQLRRTGATLITGSSYALSGIKETAWNNAISCSMSSQDLYYDFKCAYEVISSIPLHSVSKCFIVKGYYAGYQDLSMSKAERERVISNVYLPLFRDAHNWINPKEVDLFQTISARTEGILSDDLKKLIQHMAADRILSYGAYYNPTRARGGTIFNLNGREWYELPADEMDYLGKYRADCHNKSMEHTESIKENKEIFKDYVHFLHLNNILPIFVIAPFSPYYTKYLFSEMRESIMELLDAASGEVHYIDFNQCDLFDAMDFVDTDHLSEIGAQKMSCLLADAFGK